MDDQGNLVLTAYPEDGNYPSVTTTGLSLTDGQSYNISIRYKGDQDVFKIWVDGKLEGTLDLGSDMPYYPRDLTFGNPWGGENFTGYISKFEVRGTQPEYSTFTGDTGSINTTVEEDHTGNQPPDQNTEDMILDIAGLPTSGAVFKDDAAVVTTNDGPVITFDGDMDRVRLGRLEEFETASKLSVSIDFKRSEADGEEHKLFWNNKKVGLKLDDDGLVVRAGGADGEFKTFRVDDLGLNDTELHRAVVIIDADTDRLQVLIDDILVLDETQTDFDLVGAGGKERGWVFSGFSQRFFEGEISDFRIDASADFFEESTPEPDTGLLI